MGIVARERAKNFQIGLSVHAEQRAVIALKDSQDSLTEKVIGLAIEVHRSLGPGLLETAYEACLCFELEANAIPFRRQVPMPISYKSVELDCGYRIDILVDDTLIVEVKAIERLLPLHDAQLLTYMKLSGLKTGLLMNFNSYMLKDGLRRLVL